MSRAPRPKAAVPFRDRPFGKALAEYAESPSAIIAAVIVAVFVIAAAAASIIAPQDPYDLAKLDLL
ncbi:ABC transporter permease, partial [bacterium]|nr:ABC transporter permease [bacterium]